MNAFVRSVPVEPVEDGGYSLVMMWLVPSARRTRGRPVRLAMLAVVLALAGCADESSERQFAGEERAATTTGQAEATSTPPIQSPGMATSTSIPAESILASESPVSKLHFVSNGGVVGFDLATGRRTLTWHSDDEEAVQVLADPSGKNLALLTRAANGDWRIRILDASGAEIVNHLLSSVAGTPQPVASDRTSSGGLSWAPSGDRLAVALPSGGVYSAGIDGRIETLLDPQRAPVAEAVAWSPSGAALAIATSSSVRSGSGLAVAPAAGRPLDPVALMPGDPTGNRAVRSIAWMPDGAHLAAVLVHTETGDATGDLLLVPASGGTPVIEWSGATTNADIRLIAPSPDGSRIALFTLAAGEERGKIRVKQLGGNAQASIVIEPALEPSALAWTSEGLAIAGSCATPGDDEQEPVEIVFVWTEDGTLETRYRSDAVPASPVASPSGSPGASPLASPVASPNTSLVASPAHGQVASPNASPLASPVASPVALTATHSVTASPTTTPRR